MSKKSKENATMRSSSWGQKSSMRKRSCFWLILRNSTRGSRRRKRRNETSESWSTVTKLSRFQSSSQRSSFLLSNPLQLKKLHLWTLKRREVREIEDLECTWDLRYSQHLYLPRRKTSRRSLRSSSATLVLIHSISSLPRKWQSCTKISLKRSWSCLLSKTTSRRWRTKRTWSTKPSLRRKSSLRPLRSRSTYTLISTSNRWWVLHSNSINNSSNNSSSQ